MAVYAGFARGKGNADGRPICRPDGSAIEPVTILETIPSPTNPRAFLRPLFGV